LELRIVPVAWWSLRENNHFQHAATETWLLEYNVVPVLEQSSQHLCAGNNTPFTVSSLQV
jgi:hypothetical protein